MLLKNESLLPEAAQHFGLSGSPFVDDVQTPDDVYQSPNVRFVRDALMRCAMQHGFLCVIGESGSGKTTLAEDLEARIASTAQPIVLVKPHVLAMEQTDPKGRVTKASHFAEAIANALDPAVRMKNSPEEKFEQVHQMLRASHRDGRCHLLLIEEAHCMPDATLKQLKRFRELKDGMRRMIGIAMVAQPELRDRLQGQNPELREVAQRCEIVEISPLDADVEGYLRFKFSRFGVRYEDVMADDAAQAIQARMMYSPRGGRPEDTRSMCYPLVVNNLVSRALNAAARAGWPKVDAQVIATC